MLEPFTLPFMQRGLIEVLLLATAAGLLGTWIVLRGLAFHAHAVGTATFPGLVLADGLGFAASLGALGAALVFTGGVAVARSRSGDDHGPAIALVLVACLAGGVILASDVFHSAANVDSLLFGSLLLIDTGDLVLAGIAAALALLATLTLGRRWLAEGFDPQAAPALGLRSRLPTAALLVLVAFTAVAALAAVGALLATALLVVPAVTTRLVFDRLTSWQVATVALAAVEGIAGLLLSYWTDAPPGATIAVVSGGVFAAVGLLRVLRGHRATAAAAAAVGAAGLLGCGSNSADAGRLQVVATTPVAADFARQVGGDAVQVTQILHPNSDPHAYEPRPSDVRHTADAQVVLESGLDLDHWIDEVVDQSGADPDVVDLSASLPARRGDDPHWWHDPDNARAAVTAIATAFAAARPDERATFAANAAAYRGELDTLEAETRACLDAVPADARKLVTDHDALGYFAQHYGIDVVGAVIPSQSTQAQASAGEVADLVKTIRAQGVKAVFPESSVNPDLAKTIARETGAQVGEELYADTLGPEGSSGATYVQAERHNADALVRGFTGGARGCGEDG